MTSSITKLVKFFRLEADRGYDNRAVVGGLQNMLAPWQEEARSEGVPEDFIQLVGSRLADYARLSPKSRREVLEGIWNRIQHLYPDLIHEALPPLHSQDRDPQEMPSRTALEEPPPDEREKLPGAAVQEPQSPPPASAIQEPSGAAPALEPEPVPPAAEEPAPPPPEHDDAGEKTPPIPEGPPVALDAPLSSIQGIGPKSAKTLSKLGLGSLEDLLWYIPRRYDDYSRLETINRLWYGQEVTIIGTVESVEMRTVRGGRMKLTEVVIGDGTGTIRVTWFNQPWVADRLKTGKAIVVSGKVDQYLGRLTMNNPDWEAVDRKQLHTNRIVPVYPLTSGVTNKWIRRIIHNVIMRYYPRIPDPLPDDICREEKLIPRNVALQQIHFPDDWKRLESAQQRLAFDEMFLLQLGVLRQKMDWESIHGEPLLVSEDWIEDFQRALPYALTASQVKSLQAIRKDMASEKPMNRLLQGDVGSGKTVVAALGMGIAAENGAQSAFMAPTSILAEQHFQTLRDLLPNACSIAPDAIRILIGSTGQADRKEILEGLQDGSIQVIVGTHALLEDPVVFRRIGLLIIDEQHRFGVEQRARMRAKGDNPNLLVMTATPIPRSLALTIYGDLDLTLLDELPPGRQEIETRVLSPLERSRAHNFIISQLREGRQAFVIYPLVEGSEKVQAKAAVDEHKRLQDDVFINFKVGLLHGRLRPDEKDAVMAEFRSGDLDVLVSTSVVEVGVDIPNASVMIVEGANHFGLAQLHQFRGRVGRGEHKSYCLLIPDTDDDTDNQRLKAMESTNDGFVLAELDLDQRGPGQFLGTRQSGFGELQTAQLTDVHLIERSRMQAQNLFEKDPELSDETHQALADEVERFWTIEKGEIS
jgi:ATP-dependent DNA helicase RecG